jgi:hypothetical protein
MIERDSNTTAIAGITEYLQRHLGRQATSYIAGLKDATMVAKWRDGVEPRQVTRMKLRHAYIAVRMIAEAFDDRTVEAWFFGSNTRLDGEAPAWVLRYAKSLDDVRFVVPAAKAFARAPE